MKKRNLLLVLASLTTLTSCGEENNSIESVKNSESESINESVSVNESVIDSISSSEIKSDELSESESASESESTSVIAVKAISKNDSFVNFEANKKEKENKKIEFVDKDNTYKVGDDNAINLLPNTTFIEKDENGNIDDVEVESWEYDINISYKKDDSYVVSDASFTDSIDYVNCLVDFSSSAVGNSFKVDITPKKLTAKQLENVSKYTVSMEFDVVDGYNCYEAAELAYINNSTTGIEYSNTTQSAAWAEFKEKHNLNANYYPTRIIFHNDIKVTAEDIPSAYIYSEADVAKTDGDYDRVVGTLKDWAYIYERVLGENESFELEGNYFSLDASSLPLVVRESNKITDEGQVISHATLLRFRLTSDDIASTTSASVCNTNLIGNAPRQENTVLSGGILFNKAVNVAVSSYNNISTCWFISYMMECNMQKYLIKDCKGYDNFNSFIYNWGSSDVEIDGCEFIGAGGPIIIQDHVASTSENGGYIPKTTIRNSNLESYVAGSEGWFSVVHATEAATGIKAIDQIFNAYGKSYLKKSDTTETTYLNFICINKSGDSQSPTGSKVSGSCIIDDVAYDYGETNGLKAFYDTVFALGAPAFQTSAGGYAYTDAATGLYDATQTKMTDLSNAMFSGDYITIYYNGMMIVLANYHSLTA